MGTLAQRTLGDRAISSLYVKIILFTQKTNTLPQIPSFKIMFFVFIAIINSSLIGISQAKSGYSYCSSEGRLIHLLSHQNPDLAIRPCEKA
jgi:hypothetical protein